MKAKEYYQNYLNNINNISFEFLIVSSLKDMTIEISDIINKRKIKDDNAAISVIKEVNQKANSYINMVNAHLSEENKIRHNALIYFIESEIPKLKSIVEHLK
jgi:hypothetical protein